MCESELVKKVAAATAMKQKDVRTMILAMKEIALAEVGAGGEVKLDKFGTLRTTEIEGRDFVNPRTGKASVIPTHRRCRFIPALALREAIANA